jgi:hypothetical protein
MRLTLLMMGVLGSTLALGPWTTADAGEQAAKGVRPGQLFGSVEIQIGMPEANAFRLLSSRYQVQPVEMPGIHTYMIKEKEGSNRTMGLFSAREGRVFSISSDWTPRINDAGALTDALLVLLGRLTSSDKRNGWRSAEPCSVNFAGGLTAGTDTQLSTADIICGRQKVSITSTRTSGGTSQPQLDFITEE